MFFALFFFEIEFLFSVKYKMTGVRARLKRILGINPETPEPLGNQKKYGLMTFPTQIRAAAHMASPVDLVPESLK